MKNQFLKKTMALALAGAMTLSMAACGKDDAGNDSQADTQQSEQQESSAEDSGESSAETITAPCPSSTAGLTAGAPVPSCICFIIAL